MKRCNSKSWRTKEQIENRIIDDIDEGRRKNPQKKKPSNLIKTGQNDETLRDECHR